MKYPKGKKGRDYRLETYFVGGKMKHRRVRLVGGIEVEDFLHAHADDSILVEDGHEDLLFEREQERGPKKPVQTRPTSRPV